MVTLLAYRAPRLPAPTAHGRPRRVHRVNHALRFPKSGQTALYVLFPLSILVILLNFPNAPVRRMYKS
jgi:hypothetical protein